MSKPSFQRIAQAELEAKMEPCAYINPEEVVEGTPEESGHIFLASADGQFLAGIWECSPCKEEIASYPANEYMHVLAGEVVITGNDGSSQSFKAGDQLVMQKGWSGTWHMTQPFKKYFVMYLG